MSSTTNGHVQPVALPELPVALPRAPTAPTEHRSTKSRARLSDARRPTPPESVTRPARPQHSSAADVRLAPWPSIPKRIVAELKELRELTGDENGAQRVAWTETWERARELAPRTRSPALPLERERSTRPATSGSRSRGDSERAVLIGGHIDSVPNGGWLDGCLNVVAGVEVLRRIAEDGHAAGHGPARQLGRRGGRALRPQLFGSSAAAGSMADQDELRQLTDRDGIVAPRRARRVRRRPRPRARRAVRSSRSAAAYLELHIEQGPVLESLGLPLGVVLGTFGVERHRITWTGQAAHAGSTPMDRRRDALAGAAKLALEIRDIAARDGRRRRLHVGRRRLQARESSPRSSRRPSSSSTSATSTRATPRRDARRGEGGERAVRGRGERSRSTGSGSGRSSRSSSTRP